MNDYLEIDMNNNITLQKRRIKNLYKTNQKINILLNISLYIIIMIIT